MIEQTTWRLLLQQPDLVERIVLLPIELQRALGGVLEAMCDMAQEAYAVPYGQDVEPELGRKVQTSGTGSTGRRTTNAQFGRHLRHVLPRKLDRMRTEMRTMLCFDEPNGYRGPYERRAKGA